LVAEVKILNRMGLHARPAALVARCASGFECSVSLTREGYSSADGKSILSLLMLGAPCGSVLTLEAAGRDEAEAIAAISTLFESKFDEE
jgi:phosphotransferase system HPr (HPr) family protein